MATYYVAQGGTAANKAAATTGTYPGGCMSPTVHNGETFSAGDEVLFSDEGGVIRATITPPSSGSSGSPIIYKNKSGDTPVLNGANVVTGWEVHSGSIYRAPFEYVQWTTEVPTQVFIDGQFGDPQTSIVGCVNEYDWYWESNYLYLYAPGDPDTEYTRVEASTRYQCLTYDNKDYLTFDGLTFKYTIQNGFEAWHATGCTVQNCVAEWNYHDGIAVYANTSSYSDLLIDSNTVRYNGIVGIILLGECTSALIKRNDVYENMKYQRGGQDFSWGGGIKCFGHDTSSWIDGVVIEQNDVYNNGWDVGDENRGDGIWLDATGFTTPNVIRHNRVRGNFSNGIHIERAIDSEVYGNVIYDNGNDGGTLYPTAGVRINGTEGGYSKTCDGTLLYNNTITDNYYGVWVQGWSPSDVDGTIVKNNIIAGNTAQELYCAQGGDNDGTHGTGNVYESNCLGAERSNFIYWDGNISTYDAFISASSQTDNNIESDPAFTNAAGDDFTLSSSSPCIGAGANLGADYDDGLVASSTWPSGVVTGDRDDY